jgi:hypothetical protein
MLININGQNYDKWEDVPEDVRKQVAAKLPDADQNGVPDVFEGNLASLGNLGNLAGGQTTFTSISIDGQQVDSLGQLPPEVQEMLRNTLGIYQPGSIAAPPPGTPGTTPVTPGAAVPPSAPWPLQPVQVMLNGVPTTVGAEPPKKSWWKRLFGG